MCQCHEPARRAAVRRNHSYLSTLLQVAKRRLGSSSITCPHCGDVTVPRGLCRGDLCDGDWLVAVWESAVRAGALETLLWMVWIAVDQFDRLAWRRSMISCKARSITSCGASGMSATNANAADARMARSNH